MKCRGVEWLNVLVSIAVMADQRIQQAPVQPNLTVATSAKWI